MGLNMAAQNRQSRLGPVSEAPRTLTPARLRADLPLISRYLRHEDYAQDRTEANDDLAEAIGLVRSLGWRFAGAWTLTVTPTLTPTPTLSLTLTLTPNLTFTL